MALHVHHVSRGLRRAGLFAAAGPLAALATNTGAAGRGCPACNLPDLPDCACYVGVPPWPLVGIWGDLPGTAALTVGMQESCNSPDWNGQPYWQVQLQCTSPDAAILLACFVPFVQTNDATNPEAWCTETVAWWGRKAGVPYDGGYRSPFRPDSSSYVKDTTTMRWWYELEEAIGGLFGGVFPTRGRWIEGHQLDYADFEPGVNGPCPGAYQQLLTWDEDAEVWTDDGKHSQVVDTVTVHHLGGLDGPIIGLDVTMLEGNISNKILDTAEYRDIIDYTTLGRRYINNDDVSKIRGWGINLNDDGTPNYDPDRILHTGDYYLRVIEAPVGSEAPDPAVTEMLEFFATTGGGAAVSTNSPLVFTGGAPPYPQTPWVIPPGPHPVNPVTIGIDLLEEHPVPMDSVTIEWFEAIPAEFSVRWAGADAQIHEVLETPGPMPTSLPGTLIPYPVAFGPQESYPVRYLEVDIPLSAITTTYQIHGLHYGLFDDEPPEDNGDTWPEFQEAPYLLVADHDAGNLRFSVTTRGMLGYLGGDQAQGSGFMFPTNTPSGVNRLYMGSLWAGTDATYLCNGDYGMNPSPDWVRERALDALVIEEADQAWEGRYYDAGHPSTRGLMIEQRSYAWATSPEDGYVIVSFEAVNTGANPIAGLWLGPFMDWDLDAGGGFDQNIGVVDAGRDLIYMWRPSGGDGAHVGIKALSHRPAAQMSFIHNPTYVTSFGDMIDADRFHFLSGDDPAYVVQAPTAVSDWSSVMSAGPFDLAPGDSVQVWFAILAGGTLGDLEAGADAAQARWDSTWGTGCPGDVDGDCDVGITDLLLLLAAWGGCPVPPPPGGCPGDLDGDGSVGITDLLILLGNWG